MKIKFSRTTMAILNHNVYHLKSKVKTYSVTLKALTYVDGIIVNCMLSDNVLVKYGF